MRPRIIKIGAVKPCFWSGEGYVCNISRFKALNKINQLCQLPRLRDSKYRARSHYCQTIVLFGASKACGGDKNEAMLIARFVIYHDIHALERNLQANREFYLA